MYISKSKTSHLIKEVETKKPCIFNNQKIQDIYLKAFLDKKTTDKNRRKTQSKRCDNNTKASKNKQPSKAKESANVSTNKNKKLSLDIKKQNGKNYEQIIKNSQAYQALAFQFLRLKNEQFEIRREVKKQIEQLNNQIRSQRQKNEEIKRIQNGLRGEANSLFRIYNDLRLHNYELKCQLCIQRGYQQRSFYYDTVPYIDEDSLDYEQMLQLQQELGRVQIGYSTAIIEKLSSQGYKQSGGQQKCCICCMEFEQNEKVFTTQCHHVHHHECIKKWLKIKRICPLCRNQIKLS